jgi:hypothetical protein
MVSVIVLDESVRFRQWCDRALCVSFAFLLSIYIIFIQGQYIIVNFIMVHVALLTLCIEVFLYGRLELVCRSMYVSMLLMNVLK